MCVAMHNLNLNSNAGSSLLRRQKDARPWTRSASCKKGACLASATHMRGLRSASRCVAACPAHSVCHVSFCCCGSAERLLHDKMETPERHPPLSAACVICSRIEIWQPCIAVQCCDSISQWATTRICNELHFASMQRSNVTSCCAIWPLSLCS